MHVCFQRGCGFALLSLGADLKEAGDSDELSSPLAESPCKLLGMVGGFGKELISANRPENNWQLRMSFKNKSGEGIHPLLINACLVETVP